MFSDLIVQLRTSMYSLFLIIYHRRSVCAIELVVLALNQYTIYMVNNKYIYTIKFTLDAVSFIADMWKPQLFRRSAKIVPAHMASIAVCYAVVRERCSYLTDNQVRWTILDTKVGSKQCCISDHAVRSVVKRTVSNQSKQNQKPSHTTHSDHELYWLCVELTAMCRIY